MAQALERGQIDGVAFNAGEHAGKVPFVFEFVVARVILAEHANVAGDVGRHYRYAIGERFADHVGAAFHARADDHQARTGKQPQRFAVWDFAEPAVTLLALHPILRFARHRIRHRAADVGDANAAAGGQKLQCGGRAKRVLFLAQMAADDDFKTRFQRRLAFDYGC